MVGRHARHLRDAPRLVFVHMNRNIDVCEEGTDSLDRVSHHRTTDMIRVIVGGQRADDRHAVLRGDIEEVGDCVGRVDNHALMRFSVTDEVGEVDHLGGQRVADCEIATAEKLAKVQSVGRVSRAHTEQNRRVKNGRVLRAGDKVLVGTNLIEVSPEFADSLDESDEVLGIASSGILRRIPAATRSSVTRCVSSALTAFEGLQSCTDSQVSRFYDAAVSRLADESVVSRVREANALDVEDALRRGRSTTRLEMTPKMHAEMLDAFRMWRDSAIRRESRLDDVSHEGWLLEQWRSPLGVLGFVFEGRPNVFADATGVLRSGNTVVFRIGSDALGTARSLMAAVITPALEEAGLPSDSVVLVDSTEHAAGWALFSDPRVSLAVARGSGEAVAELGAIARQTGIAVSLHGTGGAWIIAGDAADTARLSRAVTRSLDRKVCNTVNTVCIVERRASDLLDVVIESAEEAARTLSCRARFHVTQQVLDQSDRARLALSEEITVRRTGGAGKEPRVSLIDCEAVGQEHEWESNPELNIVLVADVAEAVELFNRVSPRFIVSVISDDPEEQEFVWERAHAPFVGDGFTRWVDGQFALLRPELGLSNWQAGRLLGRGGVLSGDSAFTVRLRMRQHDPDVHR